ncbi:MAG: DUF5009 domain-containing protein [Pedobacter sp.]|nr:MAG: DUF5009 domain-containing protein [Pedobacter sp.]
MASMNRILSIDVFRAITMLLMIFVNDVAGVARIPDWMGHTAANVDGMGFSDIIFPAFLFIVGLSLPLAIQTRIKKGAGLLSILGYILLRSSALIVMGFFHVNFESYNQELALISLPWFKIVVTLAFFLIWLDYPATIKQGLRYMLVALGIVLLLIMAYCYKGGTAENPKGLEPHWWGILGLIGWAYLFSALSYLLTKGKLVWLIVAFFVFASINVFTHLGVLKLYLWTIGDASSITLMLGGAVVSTAYSLLAKSGETAKIWSILTVVGCSFILFGFMIRPFAGGISKIYATPAWVFICMGISLLFFELMIFIVDIKNKSNWFSFIKPAGTSTLTCYLIPYLLYSVLRIVDFSYPAPLNYGLGGMLRSLLIAFVVVRIVALLEIWKLRLSI